MKIAIIDADLVGRSKHRFPNLACMKISGYYKSLGYTVTLKLDYDNLNIYDKVFISKVFTDTPIPEDVLYLPNVEYGGTGFDYDKAFPLPDDIEHCMPDYHLYDIWVSEQLSKGGKRKDFTYYLDYSIGFMTRGCIRQCSFCVNKNYKSCNLHSPLSEFLDKDRPYICLLDDNVLACKDWRTVFDELISSGKRFQFKQGCDERLLTDEKCDVLFNKSKWIDRQIFAFDNIKDRELIESKLKLIRKYTSKVIKFYVFCAYNHDNIGVYNEAFWIKDIADLLERIKILMSYGYLPYIMRYKDYALSPYKGVYINIASWCNQPSFFKKMDLAEYSTVRGISNRYYKQYKTNTDQYLADGHSKGASWRYYDEFADKYPDIVDKYFHMKWNYSNRAV